MKTIVVGGPPASGKTSVLCHVLSNLQKDPAISVRISDIDVEGTRAVDDKLVILARQMRAPVLTNDFNLNRVAELQGAAEGGAVGVHEPPPDLALVAAHRVGQALLPDDQVSVVLLAPGDGGCGARVAGALPGSARFARSSDFGQGPIGCSLGKSAQHTESQPGRDRRVTR